MDCRKRVTSKNIDFDRIKSYFEILKTHEDNRFATYLFTMRPVANLLNIWNEE